VGEEHELEPIRRALAARVESCFERLDDVVSELLELHGVPAATILDRVRRVAAGRGDFEAGEAFGSG
jgi:hypothetical protein